VSQPIFQLKNPILENIQKEESKVQANMSFGNMVIPAPPQKKFRCLIANDEEI